MLINALIIFIGAYHYYVTYYVRQLSKYIALKNANNIKLI